ncbi:MAG: hypothetical protein ABI345_02295 [Jatrophihabitans sp.]
MLSEKRSQGRVWWGTLPSFFRAAQSIWVVSFGVFIAVTLGEFSAVNLAAAVFGASTGVLGVLLVADVGDAATLMAHRPGMASRWALEVRGSRGPAFYRVVGALYVLIGVVMLVVGVSGRIHLDRF